MTGSQDGRQLNIVLCSAYFKKRIWDRFLPVLLMGEEKQLYMLLNLFQLHVYYNNFGVQSDI